MANITAVFLLTSDLGASRVWVPFLVIVKALSNDFNRFHWQVDRQSWITFMVVSTVASIASLLGTLLFLRHSSKAYPHLIVDALGELREHIVRNIDHAFNTKHDKPDANVGQKKPLQLPKTTPKLIPTAELHLAFAQAFLEMHYNFLHVKEIRPFIHIIDRLRTELSCAFIVFRRYVYQN